MTGFVHCNTCSTPMNGILSADARTTCHGCGGTALIGESDRHRERVRQAQERVGSWEPPRSSPRSPTRPDLGRAA